MSEVKYDPNAPTHYFRVPLDAERIIPAILGCLGTFLGFCLAWDGVAKWRRGSKSDIGSTLAGVVLAVAITILPIAFYVVTTANSRTPYSIAKTVKAN